MKGLRITLMCAYIWILVVLVQSVSVDGNCRQIVRYITHSMGLQSKKKPNIEGEWTSSRCEVRPGPKFVTRYLHFFRNATWLGRFHHYSDYQCTKPSFTLHFKGFYKMSNRPGLIVRGSTEMNVNLSAIVIHPHNADVQRNILTVSKRACPNTLTNTNTSPGIGIYSAKPHVFNKRTCRTSFGFSKSELSIVKLDKRRGKALSTTCCTLVQFKQDEAEEDMTLPLISYLSKGTTLPTVLFAGRSEGRQRFIPPTFPKIRPRPVLLDDAWGSWTCETRPGSFLTRYMVFHYKKRHWEGYFNYFHDPYCKKLSFVLYGKGVFSDGSRSTKVKGGEDYVFTLTDATLKPNDKETTRALNSISRNNECGKDNSWVTGVAQDISQSNGCRLYGINLPHTEYDLLKMDFNENNDRELYVGQRPSDGKSPTSPSMRPTSYQIPMLKCSAFRMDFVPPVTEPTTKPSTRYPKPPIINPILTVPTLKREGDKTTPKQKGKTSKGTKGSTTQGGAPVAKKRSNCSRSLNSNVFFFSVLLLMGKML